ncbi:hypothetical protein BDY21DRAFT_344837 [Lineolata rhizophorae]|uniref:Uncharacterized protein n=1 Tax=Lineolata rhizophorae TaxID=578093 RepID=A0A6A6NZA6_9PEZI|nr:hypothetical protein BDY21DRAFT_344837 [Lineolata rhizophorae]
MAAVPAPGAVAFRPFLPKHPGLHPGSHAGTLSVHLSHKMPSPYPYGPLPSPYLREYSTRFIHPRLLHPQAHNPQPRPQASSLSIRAPLPPHLRGAAASAARFKSK